MSLGPDARALIDAAEGGDEPTGADAARVRRKIAAQLALGVAAGAAATTATTKAAAGGAAGTAGAAGTVVPMTSLFVTKLVLGIALVGGAAATGAVVMSSRSAAVTVALASTTTSAAPAVTTAALPATTAAARADTGRPAEMPRTASDSDTPPPSVDAPAPIREAKVATTGADTHRVAPSSGATAAKAANDVGGTRGTTGGSGGTAASGGAGGTTASTGTTSAGSGGTGTTTAGSGGTGTTTAGSGGTGTTTAGSGGTGTTSASRDAQPSSSSAAPARPARDTVAEEAALLRAANTALARGDGATALARLDEHASRYPHGALAEEREAARVLALCAAGRVADSRAAASSFVAANPRSAFVPQVRRACATTQ